MLVRDPRSRNLTMEDLLSGEDEASRAAVSGDAASVEKILSELDSLHAIDFVRAHLSELRTTLVVAEREGEELSAFCDNYVFVGEPGTGKTTVARVMARMLYALGVLASDSCVELSAGDLQGSYLGQTKDKVGKGGSCSREGKGGGGGASEARPRAQALALWVFASAPACPPRGPPPDGR